MKWDYYKIWFTIAYYLTIQRVFMNKIMIKIYSILFQVIKVISGDKQDLVLENLALRQQLAIYQKKNTKINKK